MFGVLFISSLEEVGHVQYSSCGNIWAVLTANIDNGTDQRLNLLASTFHIQPPFYCNGTDLNGTNVTCEGSQSEKQNFLVTISGMKSDTLVLASMITMIVLCT